MKKALALTIALALTAACGDGADSTTSAVPTTATTATSSTTTLAAGTSTTSTTEAPESTTTSTTTTLATSGDAVMALTQVVFGDAGFVEITNVGTAPGDIGGHWLCQRPLYFEIPPAELAPGESIWLVAGDAGSVDTGDPRIVAVIDAARAFGELSATTGEVALYRSNTFSSAEEIVDYVEWGTSGHGRSSVAVEAGLWTAGETVAIPDNTVSIFSAGATGEGAAGWAADIGV